MAEQGSSSQIIGEDITRELLKDIILYRTSKQLTDKCKTPLKQMLREISDFMKSDMENIKEPMKLEYLLGNTLALENLILELYRHAESKEQHILYTVALFTYIAEMCKNVSEESQPLIVDNVIVTLKSTLKGKFSMYILHRINEWENVKKVLINLAFCTFIMFGGLIWFMKK